MTRPSTAQRNLILLLLKRADFDHRNVTLMYRRLDVSDTWQGVTTSEWLDSLTMEEASAVISKLQAITDDGDDDED